MIQIKMFSKFKSNSDTMIHARIAMVVTKLARSFSSQTPPLQTLLKRGFTPTLKSVNKFLLFLSQSHKFRSIIDFFNQLQFNQIKPSSQTHSILIWALLRLHKFQEAEHFLKTHLPKISNSPKIRMWESLIQGICVKQKDPEKALLVLQDCLRNHGILPSSFTFCSLIHSFGSLGMMGKAIEVLELMTDEKVRYPFDNFVCSSVISGFCRIGKPELALGFFENALNSGTLQPNVVTYTALISALCQLGRVKEVCDLVCRMEKEGLLLDVVFYSSWICGHFRAGVLMEAFRKHRKMMDNGIKPDTISYTILIDGFCKEGNVEKAVGFLNKMIRNGLKPNLVTYTVVMMGFCKKGKLEDAFNVFKMVEDMGIKADEFMYATLIDGVCRMRDFDRVFHLLDEMEKKGINLSILAYNTVINGLCKVGRTSEAEEVSKGIVGDVVTYSTLLHGYVEEGNITGILETKRRLEEAGVCMDLVMCNVLIKALFMVGAFEDAFALYKGMSEMDLVADSVTYSTIIDSYCKIGRIDEALEIFDDFRGTSISSVSCYNCMIHGLCRNGMVDMAIEVFAELDQRGLALDLGTSNLLVKAIFEKQSAEGILNFIHKIEDMRPDTYDIICNDAICFLCKRAFPAVASSVYMLMRKKGSIVTRKSYYSILKGLIRDGKKWLSQPFLNTFVKEYGLIEPSVSTTLVRFLCLKDVNNALRFLNKLKEDNLAISFPVNVFKELIKDGRVLDAYELFLGAEDIIPAMDVVDYTIMVDGLCKGGYLSKALDLCALAKKKGITLNIITYNSVINGLCRQGCLVEAFRLFDSLDRINMVPSEITYATLIDNLCKEGFLPDAKQLFKRMVLKGFKPNTHVYNSLIYGYCKFGQMEEALKLLYDFKIKCLSPDAFTVSAVIYGYCQKGDMEGALGFFVEFKRKEIFPDFLGFMFLIRGLCAKGRMEEARSILREMLQSQSVVELINRIDTEEETESVENFLAVLCDQGSIQEAIIVLNEVGSMFFPLWRWHSAFQSQQPKRAYEQEAFGTVASPPVPYTIDTDLGSCDVKKVKNMENHVYLGKQSLFHDFDSYYSLVASLCSRGEVQKANRLAKEMLPDVNSDC